MPNPEFDLVLNSVAGIVGRLETRKKEIKKLSINNIDISAQRPPIVVKAENQKKRPAYNKLLVVCILILLGVIYLLEQLNLIRWFDKDFMWPFIIILIGVWLLIKRPPSYFGAHLFYNLLESYVYAHQLKKLKKSLLEKSISIDQTI